MAVITGKAIACKKAATLKFPAESLIFPLEEKAERLNIFINIAIFHMELDRTGQNNNSIRPKLILVPAVSLPHPPFKSVASDRIPQFPGYGKSNLSGFGFQEKKAQA